MEQTINDLRITGVLVKNDLKVRNQFQQDESISGDLILRTKDGSEFKVNYFAYKYKKDQNTGAFTSEENGLYKGYETLMNESVSLESNPENPDIITIGKGSFDVDDYISKQDGELKTINKIRATFANRVSQDKIETTPQVAQFQISGVITKMSDVMKNNAPTGDKQVIVDVIGYKGKIIPIRLTLPQNLVQPFMQAGFFEGGCAKFNGNVINSTETTTEFEKQTFGEPVEKTITKTIRGNMITGGTPLQMAGLKINDAEYQAAKSKRRLKLEEIKNKGTNTEGFPTMNTAPNTVQQPSTPNPFSNANNPFQQ